MHTESAVCASALDAAARENDIKPKTNAKLVIIREKITKFVKALLSTRSQVGVVKFSLVRATNYVLNNSQKKED